MKLKKIVSPVKLWRRVAAYLIDFLIVNIIIVYPFKGFFGNFEDNLFIAEFSSEIFTVALLISLMSILYWAVMDYFLRQSVGKSLMNIYVRSTDNEELKFWQCLVRNLTKFNILILFIDSLGVIFKRDYQRFLEKVSRTEVTDD